MDHTTSEYAKTLRMNHFKPDDVPWRRLGQYLYRVIEDGSNTQYRLAVIESLLPPRSTGPVFHFHEMHDEGFFVKKGTVRFHSPGRPDIDAKAGEMVTVPIRLPHRFSNPFDEEAVFINTITPGFFLTPEVNRAALMRFATVPLGNPDLYLFSEESTKDSSSSTRETDEEEKEEQANVKNS
ncbi:hypothetical protein VTN31DRAFT_1022 [Thermomyces dupontii]|uniref:uncharacterized protein n=1 Tax=Talaromyces thermophilus TaxID=28565 RepID=UPI003743D79A